MAETDVARTEERMTDLGSGDGEGPELVWR